MGAHKKVDKNCLICGEKVNLNQLNVKNGQKYSDVFKSWKNDCTETICKILFGLDKHPFLDYFQSAEYCSDCLNSLRELNLISKQLQGLKSKQIKISNQIWKLMDQNYNSIKAKSDENILQSRISLFTENYNLALSLLETYNQNEMLEIIYTVTSQPYLMSPNYKTSGGIAEYSQSSGKSQQQHLTFEIDNSTKDATYYYVVSDPANKLTTIDESGTHLNENNPENINTKDSLYSMYEVDDDEPHYPDVPLEDESDNTNKNETQIEKVENDNRGSAIVTPPQPYCYICKNIFSSRIELKRHNRENHKAQLTCAKCGKCFLSDAGLRDHYAVTHGDPSLLHKCTHCEKVFRQKGSLKAHMLSHTNEVRFTCSTCGKGFKHKRGYEQHKLLHGNKRLDCPLCDRKYVSTIVLKRHIETNHSENKKKVTVKVDILCCKYCGVRYTTAEELNGHYSVAHLGQNPFSCAICPEIFSSSVLLKKHMKSVHPSAEDASNALHCDVCGKTYYSQVNLNNHKKLHGDPDLLPKCSLCGIVVLSTKSLARHMDTHNTELSYTCETCGKSFNSARRLQTHANWHKETKPFECSVCGKTFINSQVLMRHEVSHTDIKDFTCHTCGKAFNRQGNLAQHEKIHRKIGNEPIRKRKTKEKVGNWYGGDDIVGTF